MQSVHVRGDITEQAGSDDKIEETCHMTALLKPQNRRNATKTTYPSA